MGYAGSRGDGKWHVKHGNPKTHNHHPSSLGSLFQLDHCLQEASPRYKALRAWGSVGPARVYLVGPGAFGALREALTACPESPFPPEMPRVLRHTALAQILQKRVVS